MLEKSVGEKCWTEIVLLRVTNQYWCVYVAAAGAIFLRCWRGTGCDVAAAATSVLCKKLPFQICIGFVGCPGFPLDWNGFFCRPWVKHGWCSVAETHSKERLAGSELLHLQLRGKKHRNQRFGLFAQGSGPPRYPPNGVRGEETSKC